MKLKIILLLGIIFFSDFVYAKTQAPDPLYLSTPVLDASNQQEKIKVKDPRTLNEKLRAKLHLPKTSKIYYHNIDKSNQPVTMEDYSQMAVDKKRKDFVIPKPIFEDTEEYFLPERQFKVVKFNSPPGQRNLDESSLITNSSAVSEGILSPDKKKMVYTKSFYYRKFSQISSAAYFIPVSSSHGSAYDALLNTNVMEGDVKPIVTVGMDYLQERQFRTLYPLDWSKDSSKIALKEKAGSVFEGTWQTNIIIYDFKSKSFKRLNAVREAVIYWWRLHKNIDLKDYMWDIFPVGWDSKNPDNIVVYAYAFTEDKPLFLGTWSVDSNEEKSNLISIDSTNIKIDLNGLGLKELKLEH